MYLWLWRSLLARHRSRERERVNLERERQDEEESKLGRGNWKSEAQQRLEQEGWEMRWDDVLSLYFSVLASCMWCRSSTCCNQEKRDEEMEEETLMSENVKWKKKRREKLGNMSGALLCLHYQESKLTSFRGREKWERERERDCGVSGSSTSMPPLWFSFVLNCKKMIVFSLLSHFFCQDGQRAIQV